MSSTSRSVEFLYSQVAQPHRIARGDTLRVRQVLLNAGDSILTLEACPCGLRLVTDMELQGGDPDAPCDPFVRTLAPGESIWAEAHRTVPATPERYAVILDFAGVDGTQGGGFGLEVLPPDPRWVAAVPGRRTVRRDGPRALRGRRNRAAVATRPMGEPGRLDSSPPGP